MIEVTFYKSVLNRLGLTNLEDVKRFQGQLIKDQRGRRDIVRIDTTDESGAPLTLFLKRIYKPYKKDGLRSLLKRGRVWSLARQEWHNMQLLNRHGFPTAELVAFGEEVGPFWERFSFILTKAAPAAETIEDFLKREHDRAVRHDLLKALARHVRAIHDAGLASPDLFARHFFANTSPSPGTPGEGRGEGRSSFIIHHSSFRFFLIDMARLDQRNPMPLKLRARDLAALHVSVPMRHASRPQRLRFLRDYCGGAVRRDLIALVLSRTNALLKRSRFRDFEERAADSRG